MGDKVQQFLEAMIPELEELLTNGVFNKDEIKNIVDKRRDFEYALRTVKKEKVDYIRYIQYEMNLDSLRRKRMKKLGLKSSGELSDFGGIKRIHTIFKRATEKYRGDVRFWLQYIDFSIRVNSNRALNITFGQAIKTHPNYPPIWILAAQWEYEQNSNISAARALLSRGIRLNQTSTQLYVEYCKLELLYRKKIKERFEIRGYKKEDYIISDEKNKNSIDVNDLPDQENTKKMEVPGEFLSLSLTGDPGNKIDDSIMNTNPFFTGEVAHIIYKNAIQAIHDDLEMREKFLDLFYMFSVKKDFIEAIYSTIQDHFPENPKAIIIISMKKIHSYIWEKKLNSKKKDEDMEIEKISFQDIDPNDKEYQKNLKLFLDNLELELEKNDESVSHGITIQSFSIISDILKSNSNLDLIKKFIENSYSICKKKSISYWKVDVVLIWLTLFTKLKNFDKINEVLNHGLDLHSNSSMLWVQKINLSLLFNKDEDPKEIVKLILKAIDSVNKTDTEDLWLLFFNQVLSKEINYNFQTFYPYFEKCLSQLFFTSKIKEEILKMSIKVYNIEEVRKIYNKMLESYTPSLTFFKSCITFEKTQTPPNTSVIKYLYQIAIDKYGADDHELWLDQVQWEQDQGNFTTADTLFWEAKKTLKNPEAFIIKYHNTLNELPQ